MKIRFEHIVFILFLLSMAGHGTAQENAAYVRTQEELLARDPDDTGALERLMFHHLHKADYRKAIDYGERLLDIGYARQDYHRSVLYAHIGLGQAYTMLGDSAAYNHLGQARINAENARNDSALCSVYNGWDCMPTTWTTTPTRPCTTSSWGWTRRNAASMRSSAPSCWPTSPTSTISSATRSA